MKKNKKINVLYALIYQLILIPIMAFLTYSIYKRVVLFSFMNDNMVLNALLLVMLVIVNLVAVYYIAYVLNHIYKFVLEYHIVVGIVTIFIAIWGKVYYHVIETSSCNLDSYSGCLEAMKLNKAFTAVLIFLVIYNHVYIPMHMITKKKGKKIKLSSVVN